MCRHVQPAVSHCGCACRYDAFNVPLSFAVFEASSRFYSISATWPDVSSTAQRTAWRGPSLPAFSVQGMHAAGQTVLGVLGVPGLPEVSRPSPLSVCGLAGPSLLTSQQA